MEALSGVTEEKVREDQLVLLGLLAAVLAAKSLLLPAGAAPILISQRLAANLFLTSV